MNIAIILNTQKLASQNELIDSILQDVLMGPTFKKSCVHKVSTDNLLTKICTKDLYYCVNVTFINFGVIGTRLRSTYQSPHKIYNKLETCVLGLAFESTFAMFEDNQ